MSCSSGTSFEAPASGFEPIFLASSISAVRFNLLACVDSVSIPFLCGWRGAIHLSQFYFTRLSRRNFRQSLRVYSLPVGLFEASSSTTFSP